MVEKGAPRYFGAEFKTAFNSLIGWLICLYSITKVSNPQLEPRKCTLMSNNVKKWLITFEKGTFRYFQKKSKGVLGFSIRRIVCL